MGSGWRRNFRFIIPVRNPNHWSNPKVLEPLREALSFLSEDEYAFEFEKAAHPIPLDKYLELGSDETAAFKADKIVLFSGGLDSLAGTVEELSTSTRNVALVSHRSSPKIFDHQKRLVAELKRRFPKRLMHVPVLATRQEPLRVQEHTQRSRSFLYAALACVVARLFGNMRLRFFENGVVSVNLPISEQVVGARATRTTHPLVLRQFRKFLSAAIGKSIEVENPFIWKTKADVIRSLVEQGGGPLIRDTVSCSRIYDITKLHTHCGCCSQCLDRRFAVLAAAAAEHDPVEMYKVELLTDPRERPNDQTMAESYARTALEFRDMDERGFFGRFSGETARVCLGFPSAKSDDVARRVLELHQRHGQAIGGVLKAAVEDHSAELVRRSLPPSSLLMMTLAPGATPALSSAGKRADPLEPLIEVETETAAPRSRGKSQPSLERARRALKELYPEGALDQATVPNAILFKRVGKYLKQADLLGVSDDTILRAAGRRK
jgi:hypothetical protein